MNIVTEARPELTPDKRDDETLRALTLTYLAVLDRLGPGRKRVWHSDMWLGRDKVPAERAGGLASHVGRCTRTLERYFAVFRSLDLMKVWQPPEEDAPAYARTRKGTTYNCYELIGEVPHALQEIFAVHYAHLAKALGTNERAALTMAPTVEAGPRATAPSAFAAAYEVMAARALAAMGPPGP